MNNDKALTDTAIAEAATTSRGEKHKSTEWPVLVTRIVLRNKSTQRCSFERNIDQDHTKRKPDEDGCAAGPAEIT